MKNFIAKADEAFGRIDGLVNSAAVATRGNWLESDEGAVATPELMDKLYALNMRAPFLATQARTTPRPSSGALCTRPSSGALCTRTAHHGTPRPRRGAVLDDANRAQSRGG